MSTKESTPSSSISAKDIRASLESLDLAVRNQFCEEVRTYIELLLRWNRRISLTSITSPEEIVRTHFAESLLATKATRGGCVRLGAKAKWTFEPCWSAV